MHPFIADLLIACLKYSGETWNSVAICHTYSCWQHCNQWFWLARSIFLLEDNSIVWACLLQRVWFRD